MNGQEGEEGGGGGGHFRRPPSIATHFHMYNILAGHAEEVGGGGGQ